MRALLDYDSDGNSESDCSSSNPPDEAPEQPQMIPDTSTIIRETRVEIEQARLKADQLICHFAETYVHNAGQFREEAIQRYRERLEGLPAEVCAEVSETLAEDDIFCSDMEFGNGQLSYGGMSFCYKVESDAAFNALSHHAWKDFHRSLLKSDSPPPLGNAIEQGRASVSRLTHSDDDEGTEPNRVISTSSFEYSELSSAEEGSPLSGDSIGVPQSEKGEGGQKICSPSRSWATEDRSMSSHAATRRIGLLSKEQSDLDALKKRGLGNPPKGPWSAEEEALIRERMSTQLQVQGNLEIDRETIVELLEALPRRTDSAIRNKWRALKIKATQNGWGRTQGKMRAYNAKDSVPVEDAELEGRYEEDSGSTMEDDDNDGADFEDNEDERHLHIASLIQNKWTSDQDQLLVSMMHMEMQSSGVTEISVPPAVLKELAITFGRKEKSISRRWLFLSGHGAWGGRQESKKTAKGKERLVPVKKHPQTESQAPASSSRLVFSESPGPSSAVLQASGSRGQSQTPPYIWSTEEHASIFRSTQGLSRNQVDWEEVKARLPDPSRRTPAACRSYWTRRIQPVLQLDEGQTIRKYADPRQVPKSDRGPSGEADTVTSVTCGSKHARESSSESEQQSSTRRKGNRGLTAQSSLRKRDHDDGSEVEESDVDESDSA